MSTAPAATAYTAPRNASVPVAHMFSTRVTGIPSRRNAIVKGIAELPTLARSNADPNQAAPICFLSMPASCNASWKASASRCSVPQFQRSPNFEQPMPTIATLSLIPVAMDSPRLDRSGLPEIPVEMPPAVLFLDSKYHPQCRSHVEFRRIDIHHFHQYPRTVVELHQPDIKRRRRVEHQPVGGKSGDFCRLVRKRVRRQRFRRAAVHAGHEMGKLNRAAIAASSADKAHDLVLRAVQLRQRRLRISLGAHAPIEI